jgi:hypothetical protein
MNRLPSSPRVLAIDPVSRGFGIVVFESPTLPIEWGVKDLRENQEERSLLLVTNLLEQFKPDVVVVEDTEHSSCRRCKRVRVLLSSIRALTESWSVPLAGISREQVYDSLGHRTKHQVATFIASCLPELSPLLPPNRKPWMCEDPRMAIFDAAAFALTFYQSLD